jgi:Na+-translocating ferredoxin:NAD+ oxidoreductase RnfD subunit
MISSQPSTPNEVMSQKNLIIFASALGVLLLYATYIFGLNVLLITAVSVVFAYLVEIMFAKIRKKTIEKVWIIVPLLFALMMPPTATWWMAAIGSTFGVFFGKAIFGGLGKNVFHPSVVGILFLYFAFPPYMLTKWLNPVTEDVVATATPLITLNRAIEFPYSITDLLLGNVPGAIGETFRLGIIVLGLLLIVLKIIDWKAPLSFLATDIRRELSSVDYCLRRSLEILCFPYWSAVPCLRHSSWCPMYRQHRNTLTPKSYMASVLV